MITSRKFKIKPLATLSVIMILTSILVGNSSAHAQLSETEKLQRAQRLLRQYDANKNGIIDSDEQAKINTAMEVANAAKLATSATTERVQRFSSRVASKENGAPFELRCDYLVDPVGFDRAPQLSWRLDDIRPGARQTAFRILAATSPERLIAAKADIWDSEKIVSEQSHLVPWRGRKLNSGERFYWKVKVWDRNGEDSPWSQPAVIEMGLLQSSDWSGEWIGLRPVEALDNDNIAAWARHAVQPTPYAKAGIDYLRKRPLPVVNFRKVLKLEAIPNHARAYFAVLGYGELFVNGVRISDRRFDPAVSEYRDHALYVTHDLTPYLRTGDNVIAVAVAPGLYHHTGQLLDGASYDDIDRCVYGEPGFRLEIKGDDETLAASDASWRATTSGTAKSLIFIGEMQDARHDPSGWLYGEFDDSAWKTASVIKPDVKRMSAMLIPPEESVTLHPIKLRTPAPNVHVFEFGKRFPGSLRLRLRNMKPGTQLFVRPGQQLDKIDSDTPTLHYDAPLTKMPKELRGMIDITSSGAVNLPGGALACPCWSYVCKGGEEEIWEPRFSYHTIYAVELLGYEGVPTLDMLEGVEICTSLKATGTVVTSSPAINRLHDVFTTTLRYDAHGVLTDNCCVERGGWFGDYDFIEKYFAFSFDVCEFQRKYFADIRAGEKPNGLPKVINPTPYRATNGDAHDFQASTVRIPWKHFAFYGDRRVLEDHYPSMKRYVEVLAEKEILQGFGEWMDPPPKGMSRKEAAEQMKLPGKMKGNRSLYTPSELANAAVYLDAVEKAGQIAALLGHIDDATAFDVIHDRWKQRFIAEFYQANEHSFGSQGANVLALAYGLFPADAEESIANTLMRQVTVENHGHLSTGFSATQHIATLLSRYGQSAAAHQLFENTTYPSWLYTLDADDNAIGVSWASGSGHGRPNQGRSIQYSLGSAGAWFFDSLGGIEPDFSHPAFKHFTLRPNPPPKLESASIEHESPYGIIRSAWKRTSIGVEWNFTIPPNASATVLLPDHSSREYPAGLHQLILKP